MNATYLAFLGLLFCLTCNGTLTTTQLLLLLALLSTTNCAFTNTDSALSLANSSS